MDGLHGATPHFVAAVRGNCECLGMIVWIKLKRLDREGTSTKSILQLESESLGPCRCY